MASVDDQLPPARMQMEAWGRTNYGGSVGATLSAKQREQDIHASKELCNAQDQVHIGDPHRTVARCKAIDAAFAGYPRGIGTGTRTFALNAILAMFRKIRVLYGS